MYKNVVVSCEGAVVGAIHNHLNLYFNIGDLKISKGSPRHFLYAEVTIYQYLHYFVFKQHIVLS